MSHDLDPCSIAILDLAALLEGNLSMTGVSRLARHVVQCRTCVRLLVVSVDYTLHLPSRRQAS